MLNLVRDELTVQHENLVQKIISSVAAGFTMIFFLLLSLNKWVIYRCDTEEVKRVVANFGIFWYWISDPAENCTLLTSSPANSHYYWNFQADNVIKALSGITVFLLLLSGGFVIYTLRHPRYTHKKLTGMLYLLTAVGFLALLGTFPESSQEYRKAFVSPTLNVKSTNGACFYATYVILCICAAIGILFFVCSRKHVLRTNIDVNQPLAEQLQALEDEPIVLK